LLLVNYPNLHISDFTSFLSWKELEDSKFTSAPFLPKSIKNGLDWGCWLMSQRPFLIKLPEETLTTYRRALVKTTKKTHHQEKYMLKVRRTIPRSFLYKDPETWRNFKFSPHIEPRDLDNAKLHYNAEVVAEAPNEVSGDWAHLTLSSRKGHETCTLLTCFMSSRRPHPFGNFPT